MKLFFKKDKTKFGEKILKCPRDNSDMDKIKKYGVIIDVCRKCNGFWLDDKEIDKMISVRDKSLKVKDTKKRGR